MQQFTCMESPAQESGAVQPPVTSPALPTQVCVRMYACCERTSVGVLIEHRGGRFVDTVGVVGCGFCVSHQVFRKLTQYCINRSNFLPCLPLTFPRNSQTQFHFTHHKMAVFLPRFRRIGHDRRQETGKKVTTRM